MSTLSHATLPELISVAEHNNTRIIEHFGRCELEQLRWKPEPKEWSIGQCLAHLVISNSCYFPRLEAINAGYHRPKSWERLHFLARLWGPLLIRSFDPQQSIPMPAPGIFRPPEHIAGPQIIDEFLSKQLKLVDIMRASADLDLEQIIVTSPEADFVIYTLIDTYRILIVHELLHIQQAEQVMANPGFPKHNKSIKKQ